MNIDDGESMPRIDEVRAGLLKLESQAKPGEPIAAAPAQEPKKPKAPTYEPSEGARRTQKIIEQIEQRRQERTKLTAQLKSREVEVERQDHGERMYLDQEIAKARREMEERIAEWNSHFRMQKDLRQGDLCRRQAEIEKIDGSLSQLRKQLDVELAKLDPEGGRMPA